MCQEFKYNENLEKAKASTVHMEDFLYLLIESYDKKFPFYLDSMNELENILTFGEFKVIISKFNLSLSDDNMINLFIDLWTGDNIKTMIEKFNLIQTKAHLTDNRRVSVLKSRSKSVLFTNKII